MEHSARFAKTANVNLNISDIDWVTFVSLLMDREVKYKLYIILVVHFFLHSCWCGLLYKATIVKGLSKQL